ncbi:MAG: hypothetical protein J0I24_09475 [Thiomonas arsenitoxydans]|uniref:Uncharacterized protein n=1 Tax=Thiomonas arsenitoxydans (strain DSM 22701 / CIP 110005 / 3As) TaxID=426114 RepID=A0A8I1MWQ6_THIA3|nr:MULTISPECIES: hypothetical protein [Thiomonas]MBN8744524.1 hypothetical protein [Thiomonas arsenitoxydans]ODU96988.1 MAG: hypothetical protein ABT24_06805 [Thiomonas sp. SCN 64-16]
MAIKPTLKPITGAALYVIYAIVSYEECRDERGELTFEEICSGYHVFAGRESVYFTPSLGDATAFIEHQLEAFAARMRESQYQREQALLARPGHAAV